MSKTHSRSISSFSDIASTTIAGQLESRLRELERNIAVAHEFIKLADESYTQVKHDWELLHENPSPTKTTSESSTKASFPGESNEDTFEEIPSFKEKKTHDSHEKRTKSFGSDTSHTPSLGAKPEKTKSDDGEEPVESSASEQAPRESKTSRHKKGKH